jgi:hypothetical protein
MKQREVVILRVGLVAAAVSLLGFLVAGILFLAALFSHQAVLFTAAFIALICSLAGTAVTKVWHAWSLCHAGAWTGLNGKLMTRADQPARFNWLLAINLVSAAGYGAVAGYLTSTLVRGG